MKLSFSDTAQINSGDLEVIKKKLGAYPEILRKVALSGDYSTDESSINLPFDESIFKNILKVSESLGTSKLKYVVVLGIGGSNLGTKAVYGAYKGHSDLYEPSSFPKLFFVDTIDPTALSKLEALFKNFVDSPEELVFLVISESGKTLETLYSFDFFYKLFNSFHERFYFITRHSSPLREKYCAHDGHCFSVPEKVGGRYSVFSSVGMFPLHLSGVNVLGLAEGAMKARQTCLESDLAINSASIALAHYERGRKNIVNFYFHPNLENLGKWTCQLIAESLGKGGKGFTPLVSLGTVDLHSMLQLYLDGPDDKLTRFVYAPTELTKEVSVVLEGVKKAYKDANRPFVCEELPDLSENSLGFYMQYKMIETMMLGKMLGVNAFNQPAVEAYKKYASENL